MNEQAVEGGRTALRAVLLVAAGLGLVWAAGCGGGAPNLSGHGLALSRLPAPELVSLCVKTASGAPVGIYVTWTRTAVPDVQGYYLYRDTQSIPLPPPDQTLNPALRVNGGNVIGQPGSGTYVTFNDVFSLLVGQTYYYRVTVVDSLGQESYPSNEQSWTVHGQHVSSFSPASVYWGDELTLTGDTFGPYAPATDSVLFDAHAGGQLPGAVQSWSETEVKVTVPAGAATGRVSVVINGTIAQTDTDLVVANAYISELDPAVGFVDQQLLILGEHYGPGRGTSTVYIGALNVSGAVLAWSDTVVSIRVPTNVAKGDVVVTVAGHPSNGLEFTPRAEILGSYPPSAEVKEHLQLAGRFFGADQGQVRLDGSPLTVLWWSDNAVLAYIQGAVGSHTISVRTATGVVSNVVSLTIVPPLTVFIGGLTPGAVYRPSGPPTVSVTTADDATEVRLVVDGQMAASDTTLPFDSFELPVSSLVNGFHQVWLDAYRRTVKASSTRIPVTVISLDGDVNSDGVVDDLDVVELATHIGALLGEADYRPWYDTDGDGVITEADLALVGYNYGNQLPGA
jgi:hypothetical protein